jgi:hypothetical protein
MSDSFLSGLGGILEQQFGLGENKNRTLDIAGDNGTTQRYGQLGDFAKHFDQSAERSYTEEGSFRNDFYNPKPKQLDILMQDPDVTVVVKKRAFASLAENFRPDLMDKQERLFLRATKILFQNKARQISNFEKLSKIAQVSVNLGRVDEYLLPILFSITDAVTQVPGALGNIPGLSGFHGIQDSINGALAPFKAIVDRVREITALSQDNNYTTWITNVSDSFKTTLGEGTGVMEFTNVTSLNTSTTIKFAEGNFSLNFNDPYELMLITSNDIEQAISDATNKSYGNSFLQLGISSLNETISTSKQQLNLARIGRGVNPITFIVEPDTFLGKRVRALIDNIGYEILFDSSVTLSVTLDPSAQKGSNALGNQGLDGQETNLFGNIVGSIFTQISLQQNSRTAANYQNQDPNLDLNYIRKKLRLHYVNKLVIQPMDNVHIFASSKKRVDSKIIGGLQSNFTGMGFLQGLNNIVQDVRNQFNVLNGYSLEKSIFVGNDFPTGLWMTMRDKFVSDRNGIHIFAGIVDEATSSYSNGNFTVRTSGSDNAGYFNYGIVNIRPSLEVFNGPLYDPLTPFKLQFDSATGVATDILANKSPTLLDENINLFGSAFVKYKNGLLLGTIPTQQNFLTQDTDRLNNTVVQKVFYDPDGLVYRWKEGIATLVLFGDSYESNPVTTSSTPPTTVDPFAGQDIMNILSLLITGEPYNFTTFYQTAIKFDSFKRDPATNSDASSSYFRGLQQSLKYRNSIYGNFVPFKLMTMDDASYAQILNNQLNATAFDADLKDLLQQRADAADKLKFLTGATKAAQITDDNKKSISEIITNLDIKINNKINAINTELSKANKPVTIVGDDISFDYDPFGINGGSKTRLDSNTRSDLIKKLAFLTRRLLWKTRANEDINLLLVDDTYDKDYDIQAFEEIFSSPELFKSEYITVAEKIKNVAALLGLEVFANTQGHIEVRNPKYNRTPSSVFQKMIRMKDETGVQVFPQFLEDLYVNQLNELFKQIEVLEDEIRLYCLALGHVTDADCSQFINGISNALTTLTANAGSFRFLSSEPTGTITDGMAALQIQADPAKLLSTVQTKLTQIEPQASVSAFNIATRASIVQSVVLPPVPNNPSLFDNLPTILSSNAGTTRKQDIINRLFSKTGQMFDFNQIYGSGSNTTVATSGISSTQVLQVTNEIASRLSQRQRAVKTAASSLKNIQEGLNLFSGSGGPTTGVNKLLLPSLYGAQNIPKVFAHMIEDENYDDLGQGSGTRYILKNRDIINYSISERRPDYTSVEVTGRLDLTIKNTELPGDLNVFKDGNAVATAAAVDYDMWRMYGITLPQSIDAPYLKNP